MSCRARSTKQLLFLIYLFVVPSCTSAVGAHRPHGTDAGQHTQVTLSHADINVVETDAVERDAFFIFNAVHHLARPWSTTFAPNGFSCARATIPAQTNLYHARNDSNRPFAPEWMSFDHEMALAIIEPKYYRTATWLRSYRVVRDLNVLLFDGSSALMTTTGTVDFQFLFLDGVVGNKTREETRDEEYVRAERLCELRNTKPPFKLKPTDFPNVYRRMGQEVWG
ncbi:hypothetical protein DL93DRAFT_1982382 [Clavulina sp. PMI_390]|nr:hypothetical protein DL93DRAFT_1982382 [Clavulina sp. PMI_390]